jgi:hypothetical protein
VPPPFIFEKNTGKVRAAAFLPGSDHETSVYRTNGVPEAKVWRIGQKVGELRGKRVLGRGDVQVGVVRATGLLVTLGNDPRHHAFIHGWPPATDKDQRKSLAQELAAAATTLMAP